MSPKQFVVEVSGYRRIRSATADAPPPTFPDGPEGVNFPEFTAVTASDVARFIGRLPNKTSSADPIPTSVLKEIADLVAPYVAELFTRSLANGYYPAGFKRAFVTPVVKKAGLY